MKTILSEEEYMERLGAILKRDFFPSLEDEFSEPERFSISEFQGLFITEDNASFEELLARENARKRQKFERIYGGPPELVDNPSRRLLLKESSVDEWKLRKGSGVLLIENGGKPEADKRKPVINVRNTRFCSAEDTFKTSLPANRFKVPASPAREHLAHSLTATGTKVTKQKRKDHTPIVPNYSLEDLKALTPRRERDKK